MCCVGVGATRYRRDGEQVKTTTWTATLSMLKEWADVPCVFTASCQCKLQLVRVAMLLFFDRSCVCMFFISGCMRNFYAVV